MRLWPLIKKCEFTQNCRLQMTIVCCCLSDISTQPETQMKYTSMRGTLVLEQKNMSQWPSLSNATQGWMDIILYIFITAGLYGAIIVLLSFNWFSTMDQLHASNMQASMLHLVLVFQVKSIWNLILYYSKNIHLSTFLVLQACELPPLSPESFNYKERGTHLHVM